MWLNACRSQGSVGRCREGEGMMLNDHVISEAAAISLVKIYSKRGQLD